MPPTIRKRAGNVAPAEKQLKELSCTTKKRRKLEPAASAKENIKNGKVKDSGKPQASRNSTSKSKKSSQTDKKATPKKSSKRPTKVEEKSKPVPMDNIDTLDVAQLLALGEKLKDVEPVDADRSSSFEDSESENSDFEEVQNVEATEPVIPKEGVNITLEMPNMSIRRKKKGLDLEAHLKRQINRVKRDLQLLMHKVHVLSWIAHLKYVNNIVNDPSLMQSCVVFIKSKNLYPSKYSDLNYLEGILKWFHKNFEFKKGVEDPECTGGLLKELSYQFQKKQAFSSRAFFLMFITLLRVLGLKSRIVMSFQVLPIRPLTTDLFDSKSQKLEIKTEATENGPCTSKTVDDEKIKTDLEKPENIKRGKRKSEKSENLMETTTKKKGKLQKEESDNEIDDDELESVHFRPSINSGKEPKSIKNNESVENKLKSNKKGKNSCKTTGKKVKHDSVGDEDEDDDFTLQSLKKKNGKKTTDKKKSCNKNEDVSESKKREGLDLWTEVYVEAEEKWISVDVVRQKIHCVGEIYSRATHPVVYIVACNNDNTLKDVTKRYVPNWHSETRKRRVDEDWWNNTMKPYLPPKTAQDKEEDEDIERQLSDKPLPAVISEYKDHPLYALKRHLLKFEGIYPPDAPTLGFVRGEPVYARECVVTLRSREIWYKEARVVRLKEEPYKIVKARPKYDKMTGEIKKDLPLELFGIWQTEEFIPPIATDGKVPRNEYGNVDLFKPCMLPIGTVHLQIPGLIRVAKKLGIDCAPATVGFEYHSGGSHPLFDGFVVCEEFKETLLDAWNREIDESAKRSEERKEKRVYGNWKRLIRGLLIRERLKIKYAFGENSDEEEASAPKASTS